MKAGPKSTRPRCRAALSRKHRARAGTEFRPVECTAMGGPGKHAVAAGQQHRHLGLAGLRDQAELAVHASPIDAPAAVGREEHARIIGSGQ